MKQHRKYVAGIFIMLLLFAYVVLFVDLDQKKVENKEDIFITTQNKEEKEPLFKWKERNSNKK